MENKIFNEDWEVLTKFFPKGWETQAKALGALVRQRKIKSANDLMRILLIHGADGLSLRHTSTISKQSQLCELSDVAIMKRLQKSSEWFRWMSLELLKDKKLLPEKPEWLKDYNVKSVDASVITEPGSTGTDWRLHYSLELFGLRCSEFTITDPSVGESLTNFTVEPGDLILGDRAYGRLKGLSYVKERGGDFLIRLKNKSFTIYKNNGKEFNLNTALKKLKIGEIGEWYVYGMPNSKQRLDLRICVIKKSKRAASESIKKAKKVYSRKQLKIDPLTLELQKYIIVITSLGSAIDARLILELYRSRWQIEIAFKRLKSIMNVGHLPKLDKESAKGWLHVKLFASLLAQAIVDEGRLFSPWGYSI